MERDGDENDKGCGDRPLRPETDPADLGRGLHVAFPARVLTSLAEADGDDWGCDVVPTPLSAMERDVFCALGRTMRDPGGLARAIRRYGFYVEAAGIGLGIDPDLVAGLRAAVQGLVLIDGALPAAGPEARRTKVLRLSGHMASATEHVVAMLSASIAADRRLTCRSGRARN